MNKNLSLILGLFLLGNVHYTYGQDTQKVKTATKPAYNQTANPGYKPVTPPAMAPVTPAAAPVLVDNSLAGQYNEVLKKIFRYQEPPIAAFHKSYMDTLNSERRKLKDALGKLADQSKTIATLQAEVSAKEQTLTDSQTKVNTVSLLGIPLSKNAYNLFMWGLVLVLGASLAAVIYLSAHSRHEAAYRTKLFDELSTEFQAYKIKANEKEKKLARELQTANNKLDDLSNR